MLKPCTRCGANVLQSDVHDDYHRTVRDLEDRLAALQEQLDELRGHLLASSRS